MIHSTSSFYEIGKSIAVEGNKPVFLKDEDTVWIVSHGQIEIFIAEADCDEVRGHRRHLFTAQEGDILFGIGIDPSNGEKYSLLAVGMQGAQMIVMERQCFFEKMDQACKSELVQKINHWIEMLYQTVAKDKPPKELLLLYDETEIEVGKDKVLYSRNNVLWLNIEEDFQFSIGKVNCLKNKNYIPLVSPGWIKAERKGTILPLATENYINCDPVMQSLVPFQQTILQQIIQIQKEMYYLETKRFHTKMDGEQALFQNALMDLGAITDGKQGRIIKTIGAGNSLLQACCLLCMPK